MGCLAKERLGSTLHEEKTGNSVNQARTKRSNVKSWSNVFELKCLMSSEFKQPSNRRKEALENQNENLQINKFSHMTENEKNVS